MFFLAVRDVLIKFVFLFLQLFCIILEYEKLFCWIENYYYKDVKKIIEEKCDVFYCPLTYLKPYNLKIPTISSPHDFQHLHFPKYFNYFRLKYRNIAFNLTVKKTTIIQASSSFIKNDIQKFEKNEEISDINFLNYNFQNIIGIETAEKINRISTQVEQAQGMYPYVQRNDLNGSYVIESYENRDNPLQADYVQCTFRLKPVDTTDEIYVVGGFNEFKMSSVLQLNRETGFLENTQTLKQGIYNYQFKSKNTSNASLEGNYSQTENIYELLVYYQKPGTRYDSLVGYTTVVTSH
jgi:hypothetical protein